MSDFDYSQFEEEPQNRGGGKRTFAILASILGAIILLALVGGAAYAIFVLPDRNAQQSDLLPQAYAENTATVAAVTQEAMVVILPTDTPVPSEVFVAPEATVESSPASNEALALPAGTSLDATGGEMPEDLAMTATVTALLNQAANTNQEIAFGVSSTATSQPTATPALVVATSAAVGLSGGAGSPTATPTPAALPRTGFADEMGFPILFSMAALCVAIIAVTRQLRLSQN